MILKRYGTSYQSVEPNFESKALNEVGFRRDRKATVPVDDLDSGYDLAASHDLVSEAQGDVQDHTEQLLLDRLLEQVKALQAGLGPGELLVVLNGDGGDWPRTRQAMTNVVVAGENRLHFSYSVAPPLRLGVYRPRG